MSDKAKRKFAAKMLRRFAIEYYGYNARHHPDQREKYDILMEMADKLELEYLDKYSEIIQVAKNGLLFCSDENNHPKCSIAKKTLSRIIEMEKENE